MTPQREHDDPLDVLKVELAAVSPSPEFQARVRQRLEGECDLLREELAAVAPSPEFAVRVRQGLAEADAAREARAVAWLSGWRWVVPVGAVAAVVIMVLALSRAPISTPEQRTATLPNVIAPPTVVERPEPGFPVPVRHPRPVRRSAGPAAPVAAAAVATGEPDLQVLTNQPAVLRALRPRAGAVESRADVSASPGPEVTPDLFVAPIEVSPIVVKWMVEPPSPPGPAGGSSIIRRVTADMAERSAK